MEPVKKIRVGFGIALAILLTGGALSFWTTSEFLDTNRLVVHAHDVQRALQSTLAAVENLEEARLAHVATRQVLDSLHSTPQIEVCRSCHPLRLDQAVAKDRHALSGFPGKIAELNQRVEELRKLTGDDTSLRQRIETLVPMIQQEVALTKETMESGKNSGLLDAARALLMDHRLRRSDDIRRAIMEMVSLQNGSLLRQLGRRKTTASTERLVVSLVSILAGFFVIAAYILISRDLSRRKTLEQQLRQALKMEALGRLAGGVAHDFNNLLTAVLGYAELLGRRLGRDHPSFSHVEEISKAGKRAAQLTRQLLAFSRRQPLQPKALDLNVIVTETTKMLQRVIGERHHLETFLETGLEYIEADPGQMTQVVMNLVLNARDAMLDGGAIVIQTANVDLDQSLACSCSSLAPGAYVMLAVADSGSGMDVETRAKMFEPFFTKKQMGRGTGLGLSTVYGVVKQSHGNIRVESEVGRGTRLEIYLPRVDQPVAEPISDPDPEPMMPPAHATILLVEDEPEVRCLLYNALKSHGYNTLEAGDGEEALRVAESHSNAIDLLVTDVIMPNMNGLELGKRLATLRPGMQVIFMSGYTADVASHQQILDTGAAFLAKPLTPTDLLQRVAQVLGGRDRLSRARSASA